ncbi:MAG: hypothetical protein ACP5SI_03935 [Chloroflexia bacterium]
MAKNLQEALLEVQEDLKRLGLEIKGDGARKRRRRRHRKRSTSSQAATAQAEQ